MIIKRRNTTCLLFLMCCVLFCFVCPRSVILHQCYPLLLVPSVFQFSVTGLRGVRVTRSLVLQIVVLSFVLFLSVIALSALLRFTGSDYPFVILDLRVLITPLVSINSSYIPCKKISANKNMQIRRNSIRVYNILEMRR